MAGESAADDIDLSAPGSSVESRDVIPDRESSEGSVSLTMQEDAPGIVGDFDGAHRPPSEYPSAKDPDTGSGEQGKLLHPVGLSIVNHIH